MSKFKYAIEISDNTVIYKIGYGVILKEPNIIAVRQQGKKVLVEAVGNVAEKLDGKVSSNIDVIKPIQNNAIINKKYAILLLKEFINKIKEPMEPINCLLLYSPGLSLRERNELINLLYSVNIKEVFMVASCMAGLLQMDTDITSFNASMLVNLSNTTDISVVSNGEILEGCTLDIGTNSLDFDIKQYIFNNYSSEIDDHTASKIRCEIATLLANDISKYSFSGTDVNGYGNNEIVIQSQEIRNILTEFFNKVCGAIQGVLSICSASVYEDIRRKGIYLCGELCNITGIERYLKSKLNISVYCDVEPKNTIILGGGILLNNPNLLENLTVKK